MTNARGTKREIIVSRALAVLEAAPAGLAPSDLLRRLTSEFPEIPRNTIRSTVWNLDSQRPAEVYKPSRGILRHLRFRT